MKSMTVKLILAALVCAGFAAASIPTIRINTLNNEPLRAIHHQQANNYTFFYSPMTFQLTDSRNPANNVSRMDFTDSIRGRGNSSWGQDKKPYRVRFSGNRSSRPSLFGRSPERSWVLLANVYDSTLVLNTLAFELGRRLGLEYTNSSQFVHLHFNGVYRGIYQLTEQVQVNPGRVEIDSRWGWLVEFDYHYPPKPKDVDIYFRTNNFFSGDTLFRLPVFIKSPEELPDLSGYDFVKNDINRMYDLMIANTFPENGYRDLMDIDSWVKYIMIQLFMDNHDFNNQSMRVGNRPNPQPGSNFAYRDFDGKIHAGPLWDFDLSCGITFSMMMRPQHFTTFQRTVMPTHPFYQRFFDDPVFLARWKKTWDRHLNDFRSMPAFIDSLANVLADTIEANFRIQNLSGGGGFGGAGRQLTRQQYMQEKINPLKQWWNSRVNFFDQQITAMNIDTTLDIATSVAQRAHQPAADRNIRVIGSAVNLRANSNASLKVFTLSGREVRRYDLPQGSHSINLNKLPKGMYMVRGRVDGKDVALRVNLR